jgi:hypothetical protein
MEAAKLSPDTIVELRFPCGKTARFSMSEIEKGNAYGSWAYYCQQKCPLTYGNRALLKCDILRAALPLRDFETAFTWRTK